MNNRCVVCELDLEGSMYPEGWYTFTFITDDSDVDPYFICNVCRDAIVNARPAVG